MKSIEEYQLQTDSCIRKSILLIEQNFASALQLNEQAAKSREIILQSYALLQEATSKTKQIQGGETKRLI
jgi:hypothetical protein